MKLLCVQTETSSNDIDSLLSIGLAVWENGLIKGTEEIKIKQNPYKIDLNVYDISKLQEHDVNAQARQIAIAQLSKFLSRHFVGQGLVMLVGLDMSRDIKYLKEFLGEDTFETWFGTQTMDLQLVLQYLLLSKRLDETIINSDIWQYFEIQQGNNILDETISIAKLFTKLVNLIKEK